MSAVLTSYSDQQLLSLIREQASEPAFDILYKRYFPAVYKQAFALLKTETAAEEIVHDVMLEIWKGRIDQQIDNLGGYLRVAIRRRSLSAITSNKQSGFFDLFDSTLVSPYLADHKILANDLLELITHWVDALPEKRRAIFIRHFFDQMSVKEIAAELSISEKTVYAQINLALESLRKKYAHLLPLFFWLFNYNEQ